MEKNTILAIVLSSIVLIGGLLIQQKFFSPTENTAVEVQQKSQNEIIESGNNIVTNTKVYETLQFVEEDNNSIKTEETYIIETELVKVVFTNRGGDVVSYELKKHNDSGEFVQMSDNISQINRAFSLTFGNENMPIVNEYFNVHQIDKYTIGFFKKFEIANPDGSKGYFTVAKQYMFKPDDYLFQLDILIDGEDGMKGLNFNDIGYTIKTPPQIGPVYNVKNNRYEYRKFIVSVKDKKKAIGVNPGQTKNFEDKYKWAGVAGKYFTVLVIPSNVAIQKTVFSQKSFNDYFDSQIILERAPIIQQKTQDTYYLYIGPRTEKALSVYNFSKDNSWNISDLRLNDSLESSGVLGWLETALKWIMEIFYKLIPNWGVSIILLTILVKLVFFPLTKKSSVSTLKMQEIQPSVKEIQDKYKNNPTKMNEEMAKLYKEKGVNPMSGCLPLLIQFPLIIAMYNLFNNYFEFRGAMFIPTWIPDLSVGDSIYTFNFFLPFNLGNKLRLLPIIYVFSQLIYGKVTQSPGATAQASSMKIMMYIMPLFFFFIFYNAPSGLLLYWTFSNVLTMVQQIIINKTMHGKLNSKNNSSDKNNKLKLVKNNKKK